MSKFGDAAFSAARLIIGSMKSAQAKFFIVAIISSRATRRQSLCRGSCAITVLRFCFVQIVEWIVQRNTSDAAEASFRAKLPHLCFMKAERAQSCAIVRERCGHAVKHAYAMKHRTQRVRIFLELV